MQIGCIHGLNLSDDSFQTFKGNEKVDNFIILMDNYASFLDYANKQVKKTNEEESVKNYNVIKARSSLLKSLIDQLTV